MNKKMISNKQKFEKKTLYFIDDFYRDLENYAS